MKSSLGWIMRVSLAIVAFAAAIACGGSSASPPARVLGDAAVEDGRASGADGSTRREAAADAGHLKTSDPDSGCSSACDGGVCVGSPAVCCPVAAACGASCCTGSSVCLFDQCVVPGTLCRTTTDCAKGQYCDPALGPKVDGGRSVAAADGGLADGGVTDGGLDGGPACTDPLPPLGRCVPMAPTCPADGGAPDGGDCVAQCQYHPPFGNLDAKVKWSWGNPTAQAYPDFTDVWSTPTVGRMVDTNCDGKIDRNDSPSIVFVSGNINASECASTADGCKHGVLRMLSGRSGQEIWSLDTAYDGSMGFDGNSLAIGDVDGDGRIDIVAVTAEGKVVLIDGDGHVKRTSAGVVADSDAGNFAWGGGLGIADLDLVGFPEIFYGASVFTTKDSAITLAWTGAGGRGGSSDSELSTAVDLDGDADGHLELLAGNTAYKSDGTIFWEDNGKNGAPKLPDGFSGAADLDGDGQPEAILVGSGQLWVLSGKTGAIVLGPVTLNGTGGGGPPTVADFDGDGRPEIGVAKATFYSVVKPNYDAGTLDLLWSTPNHDLSSSVTGSTVFDFSGSGRPSVVYGDECFLWVFNGQDGGVQFSSSHSSFTATEASLVADVDGDGHAEIVMVSNGVEKHCAAADGGPTLNGATWVDGPATNHMYRGITVFGDAADSWVGTRTLWNQHTYHVTNICDDLDEGCSPPNVYGSIPKGEKSNWTVPWLNDFRQNVQGAGIFDAPDAVVALTVDCSSPVVAHVDVRNIGQAGIPAGVNVAIFAAGPPDRQVGKVTTTIPLLPSQTERLTVTFAASAKKSDTFYAKVVVDPSAPAFHECRMDNDVSAPAVAICAVGPK